MRVLMIGPAREVRGGVSALVNNYYQAGLAERAELYYLRTMTEGSRFKKAIIALLALFEYCCCVGSCDLVHVHMGSLPSFYRKSIFIIIARIFKKAVVIHLHGGDFQSFYHPENKKPINRMIEIIFGYADCLIALSDSWARFLEKIVDRDRIVILNNGIDIPSEVNQARDEQLILYLGRLNRGKGIYDLLNVMANIKKEIPGVRLVIGGDGQIEKLKKAIVHQNLENNITCPGWLEGQEKTALLNSAAILVLPSYHEGLPLCILEAMAHSCTVIATAVGGIPELIRDGENGFLFVPGDKERLTSLLVDLLGDRQLRNRIGARAREDVLRSHSSVSAVEDLVVVYDRILSERHSGNKRFNSNSGGRSESAIAVKQGRWHVREG